MDDGFRLFVCPSSGVCCVTMKFTLDIVKSLMCEEAAGFFASKKQKVDALVLCSDRFAFLMR